MTPNAEILLVGFICGAILGRVSIARRVLGLVCSVAAAWIIVCIANGGIAGLETVAAEVLDELVQNQHLAIAVVVGFSFSSVVLRRDGGAR